MFRATRAFPSRSRTSRMRTLSGSITGAGRSHWIGRRAVGELDLDPERVGPGGGHHDVVGPDQVADPLVLDLGVDLVAVGVGIAVDLVEDEDDRLLGLAELGQGLDLDALHVAGDDEEDQVGMPGDVAGQGLADLAADLVDARRIDQDELGPFEPGPVERRSAPSAAAARTTVVPWVVPTLKTSWPSRALRTDDLPRLTMPKAAISIVFSSSFWVRSRSCRSSSASARLFLGRELEPGQGLFQALACLLDGVRVSAAVCRSSSSSKSFSSSSPAMVPVLYCRQVRIACSHHSAVRSRS